MAEGNPKPNNNNNTNRRRTNKANYFDIGGAVDKICRIIREVPYPERPRLVRAALGAAGMGHMLQGGYSQFHGSDGSMPTSSRANLPATPNLVKRKDQNNGNFITKEDLEKALAIALKRVKSDESSKDKKKTKKEKVPRVPWKNTPEWGKLNSSLSKVNAAIGREARKLKVAKLPSDHKLVVESKGILAKIQALKSGFVNLRDKNPRESDAESDADDEGNEFRTDRDDEEAMATDKATDNLVADVGKLSTIVDGETDRPSGSTGTYAGAAAKRAHSAESERKDDDRKIRRPSSPEGAPAASDSKLTGGRSQMATAIQVENAKARNGLSDDFCAPVKGLPGYRYVGLSGHLRYHISTGQIYITARLPSGRATNRAQWFSQTEYRNLSADDRYNFGLEADHKAWWFTPHVLDGYVRKALNSQSRPSSSN